MTGSCLLHNDLHDNGVMTDWWKANARQYEHCSWRELVMKWTNCRLTHVLLGRVVNLAEFWKKSAVFRSFFTLWGVCWVYTYRGTCPKAHAPSILRWKSQQAFFSEHHGTSSFPLATHLRAILWSVLLQRFEHSTGHFNLFDYFRSHHCQRNDTKCAQNLAFPRDRRNFALEYEYKRLDYS